MQRNRRAIIIHGMSPTDNQPRVICLDQFLKLHGLVETGGEAKLIIQAGQVRLNGAVETRRRKKLAPGDVVELRGKRYTVAA
jgi:ribosome-associated protein